MDVVTGMVAPWKGSFYMPQGPQSDCAISCLRILVISNGIPRALAAQPASLLGWLTSYLYSPG